MSTRIMKWVGSAGLALVLALSVTGFTFAAPSSPQNQAGTQDGNIVRGTVQTVASNSLTVLATGGQTSTVTWSDSTLCVIWGSGSATTDSQSACARIQAGDYVRAVGDASGTTLNASRIFASTSAPPADTRRRLSGSVQSVGTNTLTILTVAGQTVTLAWNSSTACLIVGKGAADSQSACADIQVGDHIRAVGQMVSNMFNASRIVDHVPGASGNERDHVNGVVQAVGASSLTVAKSDGTTVTIAWTDKTVCRITGQGSSSSTQSASVCSLIQVGYHVNAAGQLSGTTLTATRIAAHPAGVPRPQTTRPNR